MEILYINSTKNIYRNKKNADLQKTFYYQILDSLRTDENNVNILSNFDNEKFDDTRNIYYTIYNKLPFIKYVFSIFYLFFWIYTKRKKKDKIVLFDNKNYIINSILIFFINIFNIKKGLLCFDKYKTKKTFFKKYILNNIDFCITTNFRRNNDIRMYKIPYLILDVHNYSFVSYENHIKITQFLDNIINLNLEPKQISLSPIFSFYLGTMLLMIIIFSRNTLYSLIYLNTRFSFVFLILFSIPLFIKYIKLFLNKSHNKRHLNLMIIFISILLILIALKRDFALLNFSIIISILIAFVFSQMYTYDKFCKHFLTIMAILCITSLFNLYVLKPILIIGNVFLDLPSTYLYVKNYVGTEFINLITSFIIYDASYIRNFSIFTEPSYFQFYIIVSILLSYFNLRGKIKVFSLILFISTLISTFSTAGYIAFILVFLIFIIDLIKNICVNKENTRKKILKIFIPSFIVIVAIIFFMLSSDYLNETFYGVINKLFNRNDSSNTRYGGVFETIILFFKYPITGVTVNALSEREIMVNTLPTMFGLYGIFGGIIIIYYTKILCKKIGDSKLKQILIFIIILLSSNSHIYIAIPSFWMILFLGIMRKDVSHENIMDS